MVLNNQDVNIISEKFPTEGERCSATSLWRIASSSRMKALISHEDRKAISFGIRQFPASSSMIVERSLGEDAPRVDFSLCTTRCNGGQEMFAGNNPEWVLPANWSENPIWRSVQKFCQTWTNEESILNDQVQSLWLEFDHDQLTSNTPLPCLFVDIRKALVEDRWAIIKTVLDTFLDKESREINTVLQHILLRLSSRSRLDFIGFMLPRKQTTARVCITLPACELSHFLARIRHPSRQKFSQIIKFATKHADSVVLHLDVGDQIEPILGIEIQPIEPEGWSSLLANLEKQALCSAVEQKSLLDFSGRSGLYREPRNLSNFSEFSPRAPTLWRNVDACIHIRKINHIKLVYTPTRSIRAKAYLYTGFLWKHREAGFTKT